MLNLYEELRHVIEALEAAGIRYALAGGVAVSLYTVPRATEDIDILIRGDDLERVAATLAPLGFAKAGVPMRVAGGRLAIQRVVKISGSDLLPVDFLTPVDPLLSPLLQDRSPVEVEGRQLWVVGIKSLRELKRLRGSTQDQADLEALGPETA